MSAAVLVCQSLGVVLIAGNDILSLCAFKEQNLIFATSSGLL